MRSGRLCTTLYSHVKTRMNIGCDYWAADLDNAFVPGATVLSTLPVFSCRRCVEPE